MQLNFQLLLLFIALAFKASADVSISAPTEDASFSGSSGTASVKLSWVDDTDDDTDDYSLSNAKTYTISLCYYTETSFTCVKTPLASAKTFSSPYSYTASIDSTDYSDGTYFFQIYTVFDDKSTTIHYSNDFSLTDMSGSAATITATYTGDTPDAQTSATGAGAGTINSASFSVAYTAQTGKTRYAPMQTQPGSTITATTWSRRYATSAVTYYTSLSPSPNVQSTITPGWSYTAVSAVNWASVAPYPTYYYPASSRVSSASLKSAKKKRWLD
ncbi:putative cell wall synthesis protein Kre9p [[Candida] railenensis]|uniref:Cell wall synthesis protein Kre9p n=1 Tax=[Candida] railenensis TaxID=45579 RepID=A0A9P0QKQ4_9ASCO|nr:putative cell wall synthesis protein Kre9p [[Candida] railenensis]